MYSDKKFNILSIMAMIKLGVLILILLAISNELYNKFNILSMVLIRDVPIFRLILLPLLLILGYILWLLGYADIKKSGYSKKTRIIEDSIFIGFITILILIGKYTNSEYKFLYLYSIISTTIALGKDYGLKIAWISTGIILSLDLVFFSKVGVNVKFQNDIILCSGFIVLSWILGEYVKSEQEQRQALERELNEQLKQHDYIEEMMLKNEACYNLLIKSSPRAIIIHNQDGILYINQKAMELFGFESEKDFEGLSLINITQDEENSVTREYYFEIINNKQTEVSFEESIINKKGERFILHNVSTYCVYEKKSAILTTMSDITPVKQVIELKEDVKRNVELLNESIEYNKYITEFFANISHELKTPLNIIFSSVQILNLYNESFQPDILKKREDYLDVMKQNCYRLTRLINNILDMTKLDAGFIKPQMKNKDIVSEVESIVMSIIPYAESKGVKIIFDTDEEERIIAFDPDKIERIMLNLLSNALKFTNQEGYIYINILNEEDTVSISVKDTGIGIPEDKLGLIFERFMQVDKTIKRNHEGTGIGLSLVKSFVELHRGSIKVSSKVNEGSEFTINLPVNEIKGGDIMETEIKGAFSEKISLELSDIYLDAYKDL